MNIGATNTSLLPHSKEISSQDNQSLGDEKLKSNKEEFSHELEKHSKRSAPSKNQTPDRSHGSTLKSDSNNEVNNFSKQNFSQAKPKNESHLPDAVELNVEEQPDGKNKVFENRELIRSISSQPGVAPNLESLKKLSDRLDNLGRINQDIVDPLSRRSAIQSFMGKMQNKYGLGPLDLVKAFGKLSTEDLGKAPELTVEKVIDNLNLDLYQKREASLDFKNMLERSSSDSMADYLAASGRQLSLEVMSKQELRKQALDNSLQHMSDQFFTQGKFKDNSQNSHLQHQSISSQLQMGMAKDSFENLSEDSVEKAASFKSVEPKITQSNGKSDSKIPMSTLLGMGMLSTKGSELSNSSVPTGTLLSLTSSVGEQAELGFLKQGFKDSDVISANSIGDKAIVKNLQSTEQLVNQLALNSPGSKSIGGEVFNDLQGASFESVKSGAFTTALSNLSEGGEESLGENNEQNFNGFTNRLDGQGAKIDVKGSNQVFSVNNTMMSAENEAENIRELTNQSQLLARQGGGEAKVKIRPEGLGEITLKVNVSDGKVNVEMLTENNISKKLIEKGLGDLKANLAAHKLDVELVKVDVSNNLMDQFKEQERDAERNFAQQFLQDFRQNNQSFKDGFRYPGEKQTRSQIEDLANNHNQGAPAQNKKSSERRLDLVA